MPDRAFSHRPPRYNAAVQKYAKDGVSINFVKPMGDRAFVVIRSAWGPGCILDADDRPDLELIRRNYLIHHPPPRGPRGPSVYERLRSPEL
jgi:hypothetical protein